MLFEPCSSLPATGETATSIFDLGAGLHRGGNVCVTAPCAGKSDLIEVHLGVFLAAPR